MIYTKLGYTLFSPDLYSHDTRVLYTCTRVCAPPSVCAQVQIYISRPGHYAPRKGGIIYYARYYYCYYIVCNTIVRTCAHTSTATVTLAAARPKEFGVRRDTGARSTCRRGGLEGVWILGTQSAGSLGIVSIA